MKKTLLIAAAALAAGIISTQAQVYSQNIVGYANLVLSANYNMVANQFNVGSSNGASEVFPSIPDSTFLYRWNGSSYTVNIYDSGGGSTPPNQSWYMSDYNTPTNQPVIPPGQGCFLQLPFSVTNTVVGSVVPNPGATNTANLVAGYNMVGSIIPAGGSLTNSIFNFDAPDSTFVYAWNGSSFTINIYDTGGGSTPPAQSWYMSDYNTPTNAPSLSVGQGVFFQLPGSWSWKQSLP